MVWLPATPPGHAQPALEEAATVEPVPAVAGEFAGPAIPRPVPDGEPAAPDDTPPEIRVPGAQALVDTEIVPAISRLSSSARQLQNAVIRYCAVPSPVSRSKMREAFATVVREGGATLPLAFGSEMARNMPALLFTSVESSVFSISQLNAMMAGRRPSPRTLAALRALDQAQPLEGLSALERLLVAGDHTRAETLANRCGLAVTVAANIETVTLRLRATWRGRDLAPYWLGDGVDLSDRLRLRDLIQGAIDGIDRFNRHARLYAQQPAWNPAAPFATPEMAQTYLIAVASGLIRHMRLLRRFAPEEGDTATLLRDIEQAIRVGCERLERAGGGFMVAFEQARDDIVTRLPAAFDFDASAFDQVLTSIEVQR